MVAPLLIGAALAQGVLGAIGAVGKSAAASAAASTQKQANKIQVQAAVEAGQLNLQAAGLDAQAAKLDAQSVAVQTGTSIFNTLIEAENVARNFESSADAADYNAAVEGQLARAAQGAAKADAEAYRKQQDAKLATNRAVQAASGLTAEGSPMLVDRAILAEIEFGVAKIKHQGDVEFFKHLDNQELLRRQAENDRNSATLARKAGEINVQNIKAASDISLKSALMGLDRAELERRAAQIGIDTARLTGMVNSQSIDIAKNATQFASALEGVSSVIAGVAKAKTIATGGSFG